VSQVNVNPPTSVDPVDTSGDRTAAAGINLITVVIVLAVLAIIAWYLFTGPLRAISSGAGGTTNVNVNPAPTTSVNINPPSNNTAPGSGNQQPPAPGKP
jgi:hypothetical protein